jgi:hypothetical protein
MAKITALPTTTKMRLHPPADMTADQAKIWQEVVDAKPVDWFAEDTAPLLAEYCRAAAMCNTLATMVEAAIAGGEVKELKDVMQMRDMESRRLTSIGTKLRLTNQARYTPQAAATATKRVAGGKKPWES